MPGQSFHQRNDNGPLTRPTILILLIATVIVLVFGLDGPQLTIGGAQPADNEKTILVTAFQPFKANVGQPGPYDPATDFQNNVTQDIAAELDSELIFVGNESFRIRTLVMDVVWGEPADKLPEAIAEHRPVMILGLGMCASGGKIEIETLARNEVIDTLFDNKGNQSGRTHAVDPASDPAPSPTYQTTLPVTEIVAALGAANATADDDAGKYLCEETFYTTMHLTANFMGATSGCAGFAHIPAYANDVKDAVYLGEMADAVRTILSSTIAAEPSCGAVFSRICLSIFRYGGGASGWVRSGAGVHPDGTFAAVQSHVDRANEVWVPAGVEWVWDDGAIEDLDDPYGAGNGDIMGLFAHDIPLSELRQKTPSSLDVVKILRDTQDSECYPVVFVNGLGGAYGVTYVEHIPAPFGPVDIGRLTLIDSDAYPQPNSFFTSLTGRSEDLISTLAHELAHTLCLDPAAGPGAWGDASGHPPHPQPASPLNATPEGASLLLPPNWRTHLTWYTSDGRSGDELLTARQAWLAHYCEPALRARHSPSFSVAPGGPSGLVDNEVLWSPVLGVPPPVFIGPETEGLDALSYGDDLDKEESRRGRFQYKFSVDPLSTGVAGSAVDVESGNGEAHGDEFGAPLAIFGVPVPVPGNVQVLDEGQFGLVVSDDVDSLVQDSPAEPEMPGVPFGPIDGDLNGVLDPDQRAFFSIAPPLGAPPWDDAGHVLVSTGAGGGSVDTEVYASRAAMGLVPGDDLDALCVRDDGDGAWQPGTDRILFSLTRESPTVVAGTRASSDILEPAPPGIPARVTAAAMLGLRGGAEDELNALKCFEVKETDHFPESEAEVTIVSPFFETVQASGPTTIEVMIGVNGEASDTDGDGLDQVQTEIVRLELTGQSDMLGPLVIRLRDSAKHPFERTFGEIEEKENKTTGILDIPPFTEEGAANTYFDVFFEVELLDPPPAITGALSLLHNGVPKRLESMISHKPPGEGEVYESPETITLLDESNAVTLVEIGGAYHLPRPRTSLLWGDERCDGDKDLGDVLALLLSVGGLPVTQQFDCPKIGESVVLGGVDRIWGDVNCSGAVDPHDALANLRFLAGLFQILAVSCPHILSEVSIDPPQEPTPSPSESAAPTSTAAAEPTPTSTPVETPTLEPSHTVTATPIDHEPP